MSKRVKNPKKPIVTTNDYVKACRCGEFEANKDNGFKSTHTAHKSKKAYNRNSKHTKSWD